MQPPKTILVVVPGEELRKSIEFTLEAEGFKVDSHKGFETVFAAPQAEDFSCAIVDEDAIEGGEQNLSRLAEIAGSSRPVVVLLDRMAMLPGSFALRKLPKPLLGPALIEAVSAVVPEISASILTT